MIIVDTRGELCPLPLIKTKKAVSTASEGDIIKVISDNNTAKSNLMDYITELGFEPALTTEGKEHHIQFTVGKLIAKVKSSPAFEKTPECPVPSGGSASALNGNSNFGIGGYTIVIKSTLMGDGDPKLGAMLMRAYINSLPEIDIKPKTIILYNEGVKLALIGSDTAETLKELVTSGIELIVCGTCVDFYDIKKQLAVGKISNMYNISTLMSESAFIAYP